jgi:hypothetical protein
VTDIQQIREQKLENERFANNISLTNARLLPGGIKPMF